MKRIVFLMALLLIGISTACAQAKPTPTPQTATVTPLSANIQATPITHITATSVANQQQLQATVAAASMLIEQTAFAFRTASALEFEPTLTAEAEILKRLDVTPTIEPLVLTKLTDCQNFLAARNCPTPAPQLKSKIAYFDRYCTLHVLDLAAGTGWAKRISVLTKPLYRSQCTPIFSDNGEYIFTDVTERANTRVWFHIDGSEVTDDENIDYNALITAPTPMPDSPDHIFSTNQREAWFEQQSNRIVLRTRGPHEPQNYLTVDAPLDQIFAPIAWVANNSRILAQGFFANNGAMLTGRSLYLFDPQTNQQFALKMLLFPNNIAYHPTNSNLLAIPLLYDQCGVYILNAATLQQTCLTTAATQNAKWSPDGSIVAFASYDGSLAVSFLDKPVPKRTIAQRNSKIVTVLGWLSPEYILSAAYRVHPNGLDVRIQDNTELWLTSIDGKTDILLTSNVAAPNCQIECRWNDVVDVYTAP